jgi:hypothetical protein
MATTDMMLGFGFTILCVILMVAVFRSGLKDD